MTNINDKIKITIIDNYNNWLPSIIIGALLSMLNG